jgi:hypothetical protein
MDEMMIERLSVAEDRKWSALGFGGMYDPEEIDPFEDEEEEEEYDWEGHMEDLAFDMAREG